MGRCCLMGTEGKICKMRKFWRTAVQQCECTYYWTVHLMVKMVNFVFFLKPQLKNKWTVSCSIFSWKITTFEYIHTNRILNFIQSFLSRNFKRKAKYNIVSHQLIYQALCKVHQRTQQLGFTTEYLPLIRWSGCPLMPGVVPGRRAIRLIRFCHLGVYILLEETDHQERNEIILYCEHQARRRGGGGLRHARESPEAGLTKKASPRRQTLWRPEARGARRRARGNEWEAEGTAGAQGLTLVSKRPSA